MSRKYKLVLEDTSPSEMKRFEVWMVGVLKETYEHKKNQALLNQYAKSLSTTNSGTIIIPVLEIIRAISKLEFKNHESLTIEDLMKYEKSIFTNYSPDSSCVVNYTDSQGIKKDGAISLEWKPFTGLNLENEGLDADIVFGNFHTSFELYIYNSDLSEIAFTFKVGNFDLWLHLIDLLGFSYTTHFEETITKKYFTKIDSVYFKPDELDAVYEGGIPKFIKMSDTDLYYHLDLILDSMDFSSYFSDYFAGIGNTDEGTAVLNILYAIKDRKVLYEKLKNTGLLKRIYDKLHADNIDDLIRFLTRLVEEYDQSQPENTVYFENSYYLFRNVHLKTEWSDKDIIINNYKDKYKFEGKARASYSAKELDRMYPPGITEVYDPEKYITNLPYNPLEKLNFGTKFDDGDFVGDDGTFVLAIKLHNMASRQSNWDLFNIATDLLSLLSGAGMLRIIATKGVSLSAKAIASAVLIKDMTHYAMLSNKTLENWHSNGYGWLAKIWMGFSVGIDLLSLSLYDLTILSRHGKAAANLADTEKETAEINKIVQKANQLVEAEIGEDVTKMTSRKFEKVVKKVEKIEKSNIKNYTLAEREQFWRELKEKHFPDNDWDKTVFETEGINFNKFKEKNKKVYEDMYLLYGEKSNANKYLPNIIGSGSTIPKKIIVNKNDKFYKLVPEGSNINSPSVYYINKTQLEILKQSPENIEQLLGLPLSSVAKKYHVFEIVSRSDKNIVFSSKTAPTKQYKIDSASGINDSYKTTGGGLQILIIDNADMLKWKKSTNPVDEIIPKTLPKITKN